MLLVWRGLSSSLEEATARTWSEEAKIHSKAEMNSYELWKNFEIVLRRAFLPNWASTSSSTRWSVGCDKKFCYMTSTIHGLSLDFVALPLSCRCKKAKAGKDDENSFRRRGRDAHTAPNQHQQRSIAPSTTRTIILGDIFSFFRFWHVSWWNSKNFLLEMVSDAKPARAPSISFNKVGAREKIKVFASGVCKNCSFGRSMAAPHSSKRDDDSEGMRARLRRCVLV